jgi:hypothetical protein
MYLAIRRYQVDSSSVDKVMERVDDGFVPIISDAPGFFAYYAIDAGGGEIATVSVFEDQAGAEESNQMAADYVKQNLASLLPDPPEITAGEVGVHEEASEKGEPGRYATVRQYQINQGAVHEALQQFNEGIVPILKERSGFVEYYGLEGENEIAAINIFEDQAEAEESNEVAGEYVNENLTSILPLSPKITAGEIAVFRAG